MDLKQGIKSEVDSGKGSDDSNQSASMHMKSCTDCRTTRTPLWRGGPEGPKTLCNACGIKYNKKRRELLGLDTVSRKEKGKKKQKSTTAAESSRSRSRSRRSSEMSQSYRVKLTTALGGEKMFRRLKKKLGGNLKEEEHAAILLMALSCGSVYG